jgi:ParB family transcriptional regulator, chromosome partitioning protein
VTSKKEEAVRLAAAALDPNLTPRTERRQPRVAMNAVTDFTGELSRVERDLNETREKLALHDGSLPTRRLDPKLIKPSKFANRIEHSFGSAAYAELKREIGNANGNVQPIKVRPIGGGGYEIVYGHRRHRACLDLGIEVLATIDERLTDKELFEEMSRENEQREDLSAYELATHYKRAIDFKLYKNWSELAAVLGKTKGLMSRYSALADLPKAIVDAFPSPNDIQPKWAQKLRQVLDADAPAVLQAAKETKGKNLSAKTVFQALINQPGKVFARLNFVFGGWTESAQKVNIEIDKSKLSTASLDSLRNHISSLEHE